MKKKTDPSDHLTRLFYLLGIIIVMPAILIERLHDVWWGVESVQSLRQDATAFFVLIAFCILAIYAKWLQKIHRREKREKIESTMTVIELWSEGVRRRFAKWSNTHISPFHKKRLIDGNAIDGNAAIVLLGYQNNKYDPNEKSAIQLIADDDQNQLTIMKNGKKLCSIPRLDVNSLNSLNSDRAKGQ